MRRTFLVSTTSFSGCSQLSQARLVPLSTVSTRAAEDHSIVRALLSLVQKQCLECRREAKIYISCSGSQMQAARPASGPIISKQCHVPLDLPPTLSGCTWAQAKVVFCGDIQEIGSDLQVQAALPASLLCLIAEMCKRPRDHAVPRCLGELGCTTQHNTSQQFAQNMALIGRIEAVLCCLHFWYSYIGALFS